MWLWKCELHRLGFRERSADYWQCERRFGLPENAYLSVWIHAREREHHLGRELLDVSAFHVTFQLDVDRVHFYFHEVGDHVWEPGGHTSSTEIRRHGVEPSLLRDLADDCAALLVAQWGGELLDRS